jgi:CheY-like chemotaxis protein
MLKRTLPKMIDIEMRLGDKLPLIKADPAQLHQIVMNLAVNARDAMPSGGRLEILTKSVTLDEAFIRSDIGVQPGEYVLLSISDSGCGMKAEDLERAFEPFFTTKDVGKGTGLGLAIVYGIVQSHGAGIVCNSEPDRGTVFKIYFPVFKYVGKGHAGEKTEALIVGGGETILLIDDEESVRKLGEKVLNRFGFSVLTARNGKEGIDLFERHKGKISLIILDLIMPGMGGGECLVELLKIDPKAKILIASGYAADGQIEASLQKGAKASIGKPYDARRLLATIRRILDDEGP